MINKHQQLPDAFSAFIIGLVLALLLLVVSMLVTGCEIPILSEDNDTFIEKTPSGALNEVTIDSTGDVVSIVGDSNADEAGGIVTGEDADSNIDKDQQTGGASE
jgi:hypothetical protein